MNNSSETKTHSKTPVSAICQNCKQNFLIEEEDFNFYEKIKVPAPTFCPECRLQRRMAWRNERVLYKRLCDLCNKSIFAMYHESVSFPVYCRECWYGDGWDPSSYGREYDMSRSFFEQYKELLNVVPRLALFQRNTINSDYTNMTGESKNVYLSVSVINSEDVFYSKNIDKSRVMVDSLNVLNSENLYQNVEAQSNYNSQYLLLCRTCIDSYYLVDCVNCSNCFMSFNLRNKEFYIRNKQYTREEYFKEIGKFNLKSRDSRDVLIQEFEEIKKKSIYRFANINKCTNVTGNNLLNNKNCKECFEVYDAENSKYCYRAFNFKECMDFCFGTKSELIYEYAIGALNDYNVKFSCSLNNVRNADYSDFCGNCTNIFGCIALRNQENCVFNKQYSKEEFIKLREKIIEQMRTMPYIDKMGRKYEYGEFFPIEISPHAYNETLASDIFPMDKIEVEKNGYRWRDQDVKNFDITISADKIPDNIDEVNDEILKEVLGCAHAGNCGHRCNTAFRLTDFELKFYKKHDIPIPVLCSNCRYYERMQVLTPLKTWHRKCMKDGCQNEFETAYAPDRPEIVYCERCYQQEVY